VRSPADERRRLAQISFSAKAYGRRSFQPRSQALNGFRGQRLNMLGSYATHDYRKNIDQKKKACIEFPALTE